MAKTAIQPTREQNYPQWYQEVIKAADMAESSPVRGCMVIKPWGYGLWENMQRILDQKFKQTGHVNAYFPLLIPLSFLEKEAEHVDGFAKECAVVTHHRLIEGDKGKLVPAGELEEPHIIRPTSETIIGHMYAKWVQSYRDLPLLMNQWCNVMRWEMRTRIFLRTSEFLWQEGHTVHATDKEAIEETLQMLNVYADFAEKTMAMPVIKGMKTPDERFPGAVDTYTIEAMMQDRKALQAGTSHFLGQNFSKASGIKFLNQAGTEEFAWTTSWGVSTRLIGGLIMTHSDDNGLILPPKLAPQQVVLLPIYRNDDERSKVMEYVQSFARELREQSYNGSSVLVSVDDRDLRGGEKSWQAVKKGIPLRVEIGPRDMAKDQVFVGRRDLEPKDKKSYSRSEFVQLVSGLLEEIQTNLYQRALKFKQQNTHEINSMDELKAYFSNEKESGFAVCNWSEEAINHDLLAKYKITPRCLPLDDQNRPQPATGDCVLTGKPGQYRVVYARAY